MVQFSDALQYLWSKMVGRTVIAPTISPSKTWEGFLGGTASATLLGAALWWATPFEPWEAAGMSLLIERHGLRRRHDDVGHQARPRRQGLRHAGRRPRRRARPHRLDLLRRPGLLSRHANLFSVQVNVGLWPDFPGVVAGLPTVPRGRPKVSAAPALAAGTRRAGRLASATPAPCSFEFPPFEFLNRLANRVGHGDGALSLVVEHDDRRFAVGHQAPLLLAPDGVGHRRRSSGRYA